MSARNDIPTEGIVNPKSMRMPGEKYFVACNTSVKCILEAEAKYMQLAKEIFGPLSGR